MKHLLFFLLFFRIGFCADAQNYQCLQSGVQRYFINGNGYLRSIVIDSTHTSGDTTIYFPYHTPRGSYDVSGFTPTALDPNGGSWLGKKVLQKSDGTFIFDSYWNDSVIIKTRANIGDSWVFYKDTSLLYYKATLVSKDTMTVLSTPDSVETIMINAYMGSAIYTADPLDSFTIILSKNHGFVQVFDLYTFPYHKADSAYRPGLDFFLDRSTCDYNYINVESGFSPAANITLFKLVNFINPTEQQLYNWNVGDIIESYHNYANCPFGFYCSGAVYVNDYILETVTSKTISGHEANYILDGSHYSRRYWADPFRIIDNAGSYTFYDNVFPIADSAFIPESRMEANYVFYFPGDTTICGANPTYEVQGSGYGGEGAQPLHTS